jgi:DNA-binding MarR family transcriptional regulator
MTLDDSLGFIINHAGRRISHLVSLHFQPYDITIEQWTVLARLAEKDGINQKELARRAEKDQTNITRILDLLQRKGLIERRPNPEDRRSFYIFITDKGRDLNQVLIPVEHQVLQSLLRGLSETQLRAMQDALHQITANANEDIQQREGAE